MLVDAVDKYQRSRATVSPERGFGFCLLRSSRLIVSLYKALPISVYGGLKASKAILNQRSGKIYIMMEKM